MEGDLYKRNIIKNRIKEINNYYTELLSEIEKISDIRVKSIIIISLIDSIAQEINEYRIGRNTKDFEEFIIKYGQNNFDFLDKTDPVTLFYHLKELHCKPEYSLDFLDNIEYDACRLLKNFESIKLTDNETLLQQHKYATLIYKYRSKLIHEFDVPSIIVKSKQNMEVPMYILLSNEWQLYFPYNFLKKLFTVCKRIYFKKCLKENKDPFENRIHYLSWYEPEIKKKIGVIV